MKRILAVMIALITVLTGCGNNTSGKLPTEDAARAESGAESEPVPDKEEGDTMNEGTEEIKSAVNSFNSALYTSCDKTGNLFYSPFGILSALSLAGQAAKGETKEEIMKTLCIKDFELLKREMEAINNKEQSEKAYLSTANGIFTDSSLKLSPDYREGFQDPVKKYFNGEFRSVDFKDSKAVKEEIRSWVKEATKGKIADYETAADADTAADILNAIYFYGEWQSKFEKNDTYEDIFYSPEGETETEMMHMNDCSFRYIPDKDGIKAVALPYEGEQYEMDLFMYADPERKDAEGLFEKIEGSMVTEALDKADMTELIELSIPRFKLDLELNGLKEKLIKLGMAAAFSGDADFSVLAEDLTISDVCHRAMVEVDEEGSRAAAVTEVVMKLTSAMPVSEAREFFIADRPFVFIIRDRESGIIFFTGRLQKPENNAE